jgi:hypothetical protein
MQAFEATTLHVLPVSQNNQSTSNLGLPRRFEKPIEPARNEPPSLPFGQAAAPIGQPTHVPYQAFLALVSFVASIIFSLGISAAQTFATSQSFLGHDFSNEGALWGAVFKASGVFAWAGALAGVGLMMSMTLQLLLTSPQMMRGMHHHKGLQVMVAGMAWLALIVVGGGIMCVAEAIKVIDNKAGLTIQVQDMLYP